MRKSTFCYILDSLCMSQQRKGEGLLRRFKRRWGPPPFHIIENDKGPFPRDIEKVKSLNIVVHHQKHPPTRH